MKEPWNKFLQDELNNEADRIEKEVLNDDSVKDIKATPEMYDVLMEKIREADKKKGDDRYSVLTPEEREYIRIGREVKTSGARIVYKHRMPKRRAFVFAAVLVVLVVGTGLTSVGGPQYVLKMITQKSGDNEMIKGNTGEGFKKSEEIDENEAYTEIKNKLGFNMVALDYLPDGTFFDQVLIDEQIRKVDMMYECNNKILVYQAKTSYSSNGFALTYDDTKLLEYKIEVSGVIINIQKYKVDETNEISMKAQFDYQNIQYYLSGIVEQEEFEKILKNLHFFTN